MSKNLIITEFTLKSGLNRLMEEDKETQDIDVLTPRIDDIDDKLEDDLGRVSYIRQLTAELLNYLETLNSELVSQVEIPKSDEMMSKMLGRKERKRYYLSKFRL
jgi:DNA-binding transcriptional regulator GbsR (MarR family)